MGADQQIDWTNAAKSALIWWQDAGVDMLVDEDARDWRIADRPIAPVVASTIEAPAADTLPDTLEAFVAWRMSDAAPDHAIGPMVPPAIVAGASILLLVDMPEAENIAEGRLVTGAPGRLLDRMLAAIGLDRDGVHLIPLSAARPTSGRMNPELEVPLGRIARHFLTLLRPDAVLALGTAASRALIGADSINARGGLHSVNHEGTDWRIIASFHPRFLLERPAAKAESWKHLQMLKKGTD